MSEVRFTSEITVRLIDKAGGDAMVVAAARVSTAAEEALKYVQTDPAESYGLIRYLMQHRHGTPFEHGMLTFMVHAPIFVWREWHRHRAQSFNEESARYRQLEPVFYLPPRDRPMFKVDEWKPGRPKFLPIATQAGEAAYGRLCANLKEVYELAYAKYVENMDLGIDPGLARDCLPVGIYSSCWVTCNPRSLMAFLSLRTHAADAKFVSYPLYEIEQAARACEALFERHWPLTHRAFEECGRVAP